ncbi:MAG: restriction endonuclease subunit S [Pseudomonadota bacterium]|nr:restriction endonuclease subunit S [Pseudomonadota bacterium]
MGYSGYPKYTATDKGVTHPMDWPAERLRFSILSNPVKSEVASWEEGTLVPFVPMEAVGEHGGIDLSKQKLIGDVYCGYTYFADGDIIIAKITPCFENGKGAIPEGLKNGVAFGTTEFHVMRPLKGISKRWLFYLTMSDAFRNIGASEMLGAGGQKRVPETFIKDFKTGIPSPNEQQKIADFLDWKTGQIDGLIAKKKQLIEKLKEKRIALITQAVTKGLNPNVPMRDSGIPWLGDVPAHWEVRRLKFLASIRYGLGEPPEYVVGGLKLIRATDVSQGTIARHGFKRIRPEDVPWNKNPSLCVNEIIVVRSGAYTGDSAIVPKNLEGSIAGFDMVVTATDIRPEILAWALLSRYLLEGQIYQTRLRAA